MKFLPLDLEDQKLKPALTVLVLNQSPSVTHLRTVSTIFRLSWPYASVEAIIPFFLLVEIAVNFW
jgi:hypothetical protein